ncbi:MAG: site-2 protease family protein [Tissierellia bacterium]|nr:site-2 protease family protein [Tissierellia bacterium]
MDKFREYALLVPVLVITIVAHELAHGYVALWMGDTTAKTQGRLSLNPLRHLDPLGVLSMIIFRFGWAKPVPINMYYFKRKRLGTFLVSIAGVTMNMILAIIGAFFIWVVKGEILQEFFLLLLIYNVYFAIFNSIPLPPLDGSKALASLLPGNALEYLFKYEKYIYILLILLIVSGILPRFLSPLATKIINGLGNFTLQLVR